MSYILDALQKAERQRELGRVPGIDSVHEPAAAHTARRWPWLSLAAVAVALLAAALLYWVARDTHAPIDDAATASAGPVTPPPAAVTRPDTPKPTPATVAEVAPLPPRQAVPRSSAAAMPPQSPSPGSVATPRPAQPGEDRGAQSIAPIAAVVDARPLKPLPLVLPAQQAPSRTVQPPPAPLSKEPSSKKQTSEAPSPTVQAAQERLPKERSMAPPVPAPPTRQSAPPAEDPVAAGAPAVTPQDDDLPVWPLVSPAVYQSINARLNVDVHVYSKRREKRFVFVNMKIYHEGDHLLEGPRLERITPDGVVLSYRGERFRVPAR